MSPIDLIEFDQPIQLRSLAKINLRLKIVGRRADGYHLLSMLNCTVALADTIDLVLRRKPGVQLAVCGVTECAEDAALRDPNRNLASRAARLFMEEFSADFGVEITIKKRIPTRGGLGGGSSNAAAVLQFLATHALPKLEKMPSDLVSKIEALALKIGADVPYFLRGGLAAVSGIGEQVVPVTAPILKRPLALFCFERGVSTESVFTEYRKRRPELELISDLPLSDYLSRASADPFTAKDHWNSITLLVSNDLEIVTTEMIPEVRELLSELRRQRGLKVGMSGSGTTLFAIPTSLESQENQFWDELSGIKLPAGARIIRSSLLANSVR